METIGCVSLNINGLQQATKRRAVFSWLRKGKYDVCLIQETHCTSTMDMMWEAEWGAKMFFSNGLSNAKGVAILMARDSPFTVKEIRQDGDGRSILLKLERGKESFVLGNVYAPTQDHPDAQVELMDWLEEQISEMGPANILLGGDFNVWVNPDMNKNGSRAPATRLSTPSGRYRMRIEALLDSLQILDIWGSQNQNTKHFTFRRGSYASRLDYWFISEHLLSPDASASILRTMLSDHAAIDIHIGANSPPRGPGLWRMNNSLLSNLDYTQLIQDIIEKEQGKPQLEDPNA